jgi:hypothetical protein
MNARQRARLRRALRGAWAAPCTLVGLLAALPLVLLGAHAQRVGPTLEVAWRHGSLLRRSPFAAITLGHVIIGVNHAELARLRAHERVHVRQVEAWGALFLLAYPLASVAAWLRGESAYRDNRFEVAARREAALRSD